MSPRTVSLPWGACGVGTSPDKVVARFRRIGTAGGGRAIGSGISEMRCGDVSGDQDGFRHILKRHGDQWGNLTFPPGMMNWRERADPAITEALRNPDKKCYQSENNTFVYAKLLYEKQMRKNGELTGRTMWGNVIISADDGHIVSAYPTKGASLCG